MSALSSLFLRADREDELTSVRNHTSTLQPPLHMSTEHHQNHLRSLKRGFLAREVRPDRYPLHPGREVCSVDLRDGSVGS